MIGRRILVSFLYFLSHSFPIVMAPTIIVGPFRALPGKKGASFVDKHKSKIPVVRPYWYYSWSTNPPSLSVEETKMKQSIDVLRPTTVIKFLPMFWSYYPNTYADRIQEVLAQRPSVIMGFNEPDKRDQANIPVDMALAAWPILEEAIAKEGMAAEIFLVSPSCANPLGPWMQTFMEKVNKKKMQVDIIGVHHYGAPNVIAFQERMRTVYKSYGGRPLLITEMGVADWNAKSIEDNRYSPARVLEFMEMVLPWMEAQEWIIGYAWFPFQVDNVHGTSSALFDLENELTPLGRYYQSFLGKEQEGYKEQGDL